MSKSFSRVKQIDSQALLECAGVSDKALSLLLNPINLAMMEVIGEILAEGKRPTGEIAISITFSAEAN